MPPLNDKDNNGGYWRSLAEHADTPEFRELCEQEFPAGALPDEASVSRRGFLQLMGASVALAGMAGCRWPKEAIVPRAKREPGVEPGKARQFATAMELGGIATGLLATSYDGRPIKIEGNKAHPTGSGAAGSFAQASILELYDPERSRHPIQGTGESETQRTWTDFDAWATTHFSEMAATGGRGLHFLREASSSVALSAEIASCRRRFPNAVWHQYEPVSLDNTAAGSVLAYGMPLRSNPNFERAKVILSLDSDFLAAHPAAIHFAGEFAKGRNPGTGMNRLYSVESAFTQTGGISDHRLPMAAGDIEPFAIALAARLLNNAGSGLSGDYRALAGQLAAKANGHFDDKAIDAITKDLLHAGKGALVLVGERQPAIVHALGHLLNEVLGATEHSVELIPLGDNDPDKGGLLESFAGLVRAIDAGEVTTLVMLGGNAAYDAPADLKFAESLNKVGTRLHLSLYRNETSRLSTWHLPRAHYLEAWGDSRAWNGALSATQPLIAPLYAGRTPLELVHQFTTGEKANGYDLLREHLKPVIRAAGNPGGDFEGSWRQLLHDGALADSAVRPGSYSVDTRDLSQALAGINAAAHTGDLSIEFLQDGSVFDGRFANNSWLQEVPDPMTKLTWDNAALIAPSFAKEHGLDTGDLVKLSVGGREIEAAACVMPGQPANSVALTLGYGRSAAGGVGNGAGFDAYRLRSSDHYHFANGLEIKKTGGRYPLAGTQDHYLIDPKGAAERDRRAGILAREGSLAQYKKEPGFARAQDHHPPLLSLWKEHAYEGHRWGMSVDLNGCTGCNACVVACQAENNIPVVGKQEVLNGREMHWIRLDRYFHGEPDAPTISHQPMACVQCEMAPCESVCPVGATTHSSEGLNDMAYNRCIGTRYCANNCPYKVRRFNYYNFHKGLEEVGKLAFNPEVSVRSRGVMEKCTYCVQRIQNVKIKAKNEGRNIADGEIQTACQQTCPTGAIRFGDLNDPGSDIAAQHGDQRAYSVLGELNNKPRTAYLARIKNTNPALAGVEEHEAGHHG